LRPWRYRIHERGLKEEPDGYVESVRYLAEHVLLTEREVEALRWRASDPNLTAQRLRHSGRASDPVKRNLSKTAARVSVGAGAQGGA
jgi:hypothetical protein